MPNLLSALIGWFAPWRARVRAAGANAVLDAAAPAAPTVTTPDAEGALHEATSASPPTSADDTQSAVAVPGWFGKVPSLGDFASRRLPETFVSKWDTWLSESLEAAAQTLGDRFDDVYGAAPPWRFLLAPGVVDARPWVGVVVPSSDRVGRRFPLTIATVCRSVPSPLASLGPWWGTAVSAALAGREQGASVDALDEALAQLAAPAFDDVAATQGSIVARVSANGGFEAAFGRAVPWLLQACSGTSFWWLHGGNDGAPLVVVRGLPEAAAFARMLDGTL